MQLNIIKNAKRNILSGLINKAILLLCPFIVNTIIQFVLGSQYLGLSSLFTSVLSVLSLAELGFNSAVVYNMYKPMAEGDTEKINALLNFYKLIYRFIGLAVIGLGLLVVPFLPRLIKGTYPSDIDLTWLYLIFLTNAAVSYFLFAYMTSIVVVSQRDDIQSTVNSIVKIGLTICQVIILLVTRKYYYFIALMPAFTVINNLWIAWRVHKIFPQYRPAGRIDDADKKRIKKLVAGTFIQRACGVTRNSLDSICISAFLGLTLTAIYNNYYLILHGVTVLLGVMSTAFLGGVGNHVVNKSVDENFQELQKLNFVYLWISGLCTVCLVCLYQPFMQLWMGKDMMVSFPTVLLFCLYFYLLKWGDMIMLYSSANGLWWEHRFRALGETITNIVLNIILGKLMGINGIVLATIISLFFCSFIWGTIIKFKLYFTMEKCKAYYLAQAKQMLTTVLACILSYTVCRLVPSESLILLLVARGAICFVITNVLFMLFYRKTNEFLYLKRRFFKCVK